MSATAQPPRAAEGAKAAVSAVGAPRPGRERAIVTPDGVRLTVRIADLSSRLGAALVDLGVILISVVLLITLAAFAFNVSGSLSIDLALLAVFLIRVFYFPFFEMSWAGRTPGKRAMGVRVMDRNGAGLTGEAVLARNLVREVEFFLPVTIALAQPDITGVAWANTAAYVFIALVIALPLFNQERMRGGDILAGTWVVFDERPDLAPDLAADPGEAAELYSFTDAQLRTYGVKELETLAAVLRDSSPTAAELQAKVAATIQKKIGYQAAPGETPHAFLSAFYAALRGALEKRKAATGYAPEDKHAGAKGGGGA
ncbi:MAG: RDD family protein [Pseudomonadota bacterium]